jgi:hypothetical protein
MHAYIWIVTFLFLWSSGELVAAGLRLRTSDPLVRLAIRFGLGLSVWPILFLATTKLGIAISVSAMRATVYATIVAGVIVVLRRRVKLPRRMTHLLIAFATLAILAIATRVSHIRGLAFPPWVDGVHHAMIVRLLLEQGVVPATADPYIAGADFFYHWGFHVPAAFVAAATKWSEIPTFLLQYGQALNALSLLMVYAAGRMLLRSREAGLLAAALAMFVSYYPGFYLSWGRYTHLAGTLVLPPLLIVLWQLARARKPWRWMLAAAILASGVLLIHVRVALFALVFALVMLVATRPNVARTLWRWAVAAALAALFAAPWLIALARNPHVGDVVAPIAGRGLPMHLVESTHNRELLALATAGVSGMAGWLAMPLFGRVLSALWWLAIVLVSRRKTQARGPWGALTMIGAWVLILAVALYWKPLGIDLTGFASLDSAIITMFLPLSLAGAALVVWVFARIAPQLRGAWMFALIVAVSLAGAATTTSIVNPATVFAEDADLRAMRWIETNIPHDAMFAVDARPWLPPAYVGVDGGYWLHVTTGRRSILPPLLYAWSLPRARVEAINATLANWSNADPDWRAVRAAGITHIYVGARGKEEKRRALLATNRVKLLYRDGGVLVFAIR